MKRIVLKHGNYNRFCTCNVTHYAYTHRGERFRVEFANISEVRSLIPKSTRIMALTATATVTMRRVILSTLDMNGCYLVIRDPNKINIKYSVLKQGCLDEYNSTNSR